MRRLRLLSPGSWRAGGLTADRRWKGTNRPGRTSFLFPVKVMGALFKQAYLTSLIELLWAGQLSVPDAIAHDVLDRLHAAAKKSWVVYAKRPFAGARQVYRYLARYTHRVGISNSITCASTPKATKPSGSRAWSLSADSHSTYYPKASRDSATTACSRQPM